MQHPDLQQIRRWLDGKDAPPQLDELTQIGEQIGERRKALRKQADDEGKLMRAMVPLLYRQGLTNLAEMQRVLDTTYTTIDKELKDNGLGAHRRPKRGEKAEAA